MAMSRAPPEILQRNLAEDPQATLLNLAIDGGPSGSRVPLYAHRGGGLTRQRFSGW